MTTLRVKKIIPKPIRDLINQVHSNHLKDYKSSSYTQEGEDMILKRLFDKKTNGFYIDVGAHHPKRFSNTYYFYQQGWNGINIDAMPGSMKLFKRQRPRDINIEQAISEKKETLTYYSFNEPALNGFSETLSKLRDGKNSHHIIDKVDIETVRLDDILSHYLPAKNTKIDFLSIDVEGLDFMVLKSIDLRVYRPKVVLIEILFSDLKSLINDKITKYLETFGYRIYAKSVNTAIFICNETS